MQKSFKLMHQVLIWFCGISFGLLILWKIGKICKLRCRDRLKLERWSWRIWHPMIMWRSRSNLLFHLIYFCCLKLRHHSKVLMSIFLDVLFIEMTGNWFKTAIRWIFTNFSVPVHIVIIIFLWLFQFFSLEHFLIKEPNLKSLGSS